MTSRHVFGYSKSARAKCHGSPPCHGTLMSIGTFRYGSVQAGKYGETIEWCHWGCVTPIILNQLASHPLESIPGFHELNPTDQGKIRLAISMRRVHPEDVPPSAKAILGAAMVAGTSTQRKRKALEDAEAGPSTHSHASKSQSGTESKSSRATQAEEDAAVEEPETRDELYCIMNTNVVGIQYYKGLVGSGEEVLLIREPDNPYDKNAIQVKNIGRIQVGHLPRKVAEKLAPLLDRRLVTVEGVIIDGNISGPKAYNLSITLRIYGASNMRDHLEPQLVWATPRQRGFPQRSQTSTSHQSITATTYSNSRTVAMTAGQRRASTAVTQAAAQQEALRKAAELKDMLSTLEKVDDESRRGSLLDSLCPRDDILNLPVHPNPPGTKNGHLKVDLLKHQSQALQWCIEREYPSLPKAESDQPVQFWQFKKSPANRSYYFNSTKHNLVGIASAWLDVLLVATKTPQEVAPPLGRGALCADAMGLGKTLTMLALILATKDDVPGDFSNVTLIVAPLSVLSNWEKQIQDHCADGAISACVYYGATRSMTQEELVNFDVVITTYQTVAGEHTNGITSGHPKKKKTERSLFDVKWKRIILDEGHTIRNPKTKMAQAVNRLDAQRRWVLTGTPIINSPRDLGSILTFLRICRPLDEEDFYKRLLLRPLKNGDPSGAELLRALMSHICIRRTKEMQDSTGKLLIPLPPVDMILVPVTLNDEERSLYDEVEMLSKRRFETFMEMGSNFLVQSNVLGMLTRLRQLALHPRLVPQNYLQDLRGTKNGEEAPLEILPSLTTEDKKRLQDQLVHAIEDFEECPICFNVYHDPRITYCGHCFCLLCITEVISRDPRCPMDRRPLEITHLLEPPPLIDLTQVQVGTDEERGDAAAPTGSSSKIDQLVHLLRMIPSTEKSLVFSQFTSFLDLMGEVLEAKGIPYIRFDGQMSARRRQEAIAQFSVPIDEDFVNDHGNDDFEPIDDTPTQREVRITRKSKGKGRDLSSSAQNPRVMLLSLKAGAVGLNLTVANNVFLMDPWWQEGIESQAIDRVNRIGQTKPVHVFQLVAEKTVESKVLQIQGRKKELIKQAFSGMQRTEIQHKQREARIQDMKEIFDVRQASKA